MKAEVVNLKKLKIKCENGDLLKIPILCAESVSEFY